MGHLAARNIWMGRVVLQERNPQELRSLRVSFAKSDVSQETVSSVLPTTATCQSEPSSNDCLLGQPQVREARKPQVLLQAGLWGLPCRKPGKGLAGGCPVPAQQREWLHFISSFVL